MERRMQDGPWTTVGKMCDLICCEYIDYGL